MILNKNNIAVSKFAAKSAVRPELASVLLKGGKVVATDSFRLVEMEMEGGDEDEAPVLVSAKELKMMKGGTVIAEKEGDTLKLTSDEMTLIAKNLEDPEKYPDYEKILPKGEPVLKVKLNGRYLAEVLALLAKTNNFEKVELSFYGEKTGILIEAEKSRAIVMPMN